MQLSIPAEDTSSPAGRSVTILVEIYGQYVPELTVSKGGDKLSLKSGSNTVTSLPNIATTLFDAAGKSNDALGTSAEDKQGVKDWLAKVEALRITNASDVKALDKELTAKTYLVGLTPTAADFALFATMHSYMAQAKHSDQLQHPSLSRHFDHIQNLPLVASVLAKSSDFTPNLVPIDTNNVPVVDIKPEVKVKHPKAVAAVAASGVATAVESSPSSVPKKEPKSIDDATKPKSEQSEQKPKGEKKEKKNAAPNSGGSGGGAGDGGKKPPAAPAVSDAPAPWMIDLRVGKIVDVRLHPDADSLYVETIDVGEPEPRTVVSGLVKYIPIEEMRGKTLITVCNLKPANMRGVKSFAMVLCATAKDGKDGGVEFVNPPEGSTPGQRVYFEGFEDKSPLDLLNPKKKIFETVQPGFTTLDTKEAVWIADDKTIHKIVTASGPCKTSNFVGASLS